MTAPPRPSDATEAREPTAARATTEAARHADRQRALVRKFVGRKVSVSTTDFHHVVGVLLALDPDDKLRLAVNNREFWVQRTGVARIHAADPALAEYLK